MPKDRSRLIMGGGGSSEILGGGGGGAFDRKQINDALDKHLKKTSLPSTSTSKSFLNNGFRLDSAFLNISHKVLCFSIFLDLGFDFVVFEAESEMGSEGSDVSVDDDDDGDDDTSWISWFCNLRGNEFYCEVDEDYITDDFNLCGLSSQVPYYDYALDLILDVESSNSDMFSEEQNEMVESAAEMLYGLIHVRYILTTKGIASMLEKYRSYDFGRCPKVYCGGQPCLPVGQSDIPRSSTVKIYCPKCEDIYYPRSKYQGNIDGAYFGTTFPHLFLMAYGNLKPQKPIQTYVPKIFGFKVHNKP
ncbi:unnamed protein product [Cochlearia groenlandica]